jgi:hypothetical protein
MMLPRGMDREHLVALLGNDWERIATQVVRLPRRM